MLHRGPEPPEEGRQPSGLLPPISTGCSAYLRGLSGSSPLLGSSSRPVRLSTARSIRFLSSSRLLSSSPLLSDCLTGLSSCVLGEGSGEVSLCISPGGACGGVPDG